MSRGEYARVLRLFASDARFHYNGHHALAGDFHTKAQINAWFERTWGLFDIVFDVHDVVVAGPPWNTRVATRFTAHVRTSDGKTFVNPGMQYARIRWGRISEDRVYPDTQAVAEAVEHANGLGTPARDAGRPRSPGIRGRNPAMTTPRPPSGVSDVHRLLVVWLGQRRLFAFLGRRVAARIDPWLYQRTKGRWTMLGPNILPVLLLTTKGRRSGRPRTTPVMYIRDGESFIISSENFGEKRPAAWPLNLDADPAATIQVGTRVIDCRAERLNDSAADRYWPRLVATWPAHATYLRRSGQRHTFQLTPTNTARENHGVGGGKTLPSRRIAASQSAKG
jgi:deazaflavin-dependent oxidoreductase (nitroreductase family)